MTALTEVFVVVKPDVDKFGPEVKKKLARIDASKEGKKTGDRFGVGFSKSLPGIGGRVTSFFKTGLGTAAAVAGGATLGAGLIAGFNEALNQGGAKAKLQAQLGLSSADSAKAGKVAGELYRANYGESVAGVNDAIKAVVQNTDITLNSIDLKPVTAKVLDLASTFDLDLGAATRGVSNLMRNGLATNATQALDIITKGFQSGADKSEDFLDTLNEYGTQFRKLGIDGATATGLISQGLKAGARDGDTVADALKEFSIRAIDGSKATSQGFKSLGLDADKLSQQIAKGGKPASAGLQLVLDKLKAIKDPVKQQAAAVALFGTKAEDLGKALFALDPSSAVKGLGQVAGAADKMDKALGSTPQATVNSFFRNLKQGSIDSLGGVIKAFQDGSSSADGFQGFLEDLGVGARTVFDGIKTAIASFSSGFNANADTVKGSGFQGFVQDLGVVARQTFDFFKTEVLPRLKDFAGYIKDTVAPIVADLVENRLKVLREMFASVKKAIQDNRPQLEQLGGVIKDVGKWIVENLAPFLAKLSDQVFPALGKQIGLVIAVIGGMVTAFNTVKSTVQTVVTWIWEKISGFFQDLLDSAAKAFGWVPGLGGKLKSAATEFGKFRDSVNGKLAGITDQTVNVAIQYSSKGVNLSAPSSVGRMADGGGVFGGTRGKDSVPALLMPDEHVWTTKEVAAAGGHGAMKRMRQAALAGELNGYAAGGPVGFNVRTSSPSADRLAKEVAAHALSAAGPYIKAGAKQLAGPSGPPGARQSFRGVTLNTRTINMLLNAERILGRIFHITQGSYSTRVAASGSTHAGGGAMDTNGPGGWNVAVRALRAAGFAAWHRTPSQGPWNDHIHSIALGDSSASPAAKAQMAAFRRGGDGLGHGMAKGGRVTKQMVRDLGIDTFDTGGRWRSGTLAANTSGKTETVRTAEQEASLRTPIIIPIHIGDEVVRVVRGEIDASGEFRGTVGRMHR